MPTARVSRDWRCPKRGGAPEGDDRIDESGVVRLITTAHIAVEDGHPFGVDDARGQLPGN
jgi:hypothetical protein